jgi:hypothetical protein
MKEQQCLNASYRSRVWGYGLDVESAFLRNGWYTHEWKLRHNPKEQCRRLHLRENLKSHMDCACSVAVLAAFSLFSNCELHCDWSSVFLKTHFQKRMCSVVLDSEWVKILKYAAVIWFELLPRYSVARSIEPTDNISRDCDLAGVGTGTKLGAPLARSVFSSWNWTHEVHPDLFPWIIWFLRILDLL